MTHAELRDELARRIAAVARPHPVRVAIDGVDGAGKTRLADDLVAPLRALGRPVVRASMDGFHQPRALRYRRGKDSPEGFFRDSFDPDRVVAVLLEPLGPGGSRRFVRAVFDWRTDSEVAVAPEVAPPDAVLLLDGIFLHQPRLRPFWDWSLFLRTSFAVSVARCAARDGSSADPTHPANRRYVEGQRLYLAECDPAACATAVVDYDDLEQPSLSLRA
jgi:uridine kinase